MNFTELIQTSVKKKTEFFAENNTPFEKKINIGFGADNAFIRPLGVAITSLAIHNPNIFFNFYLFLSSSSEENLAKLERLTQKYSNIKLTLYEVEQDNFKQLPTLLHLPLPIYFRLLMPVTLCELDIILYLDCDILCLKSIEELLNTDMDNKAAVVTEAREQDEHISRLNLPLEKYFSSGFILIDINKWNELNVSETALNLLIEKPNNFTMPDQDALNAVLSGQVKYLPAKWNFHEKVREIPADVIIFHYGGRIKPWSCVCDNINQTYYLKYEALSPWDKTPLELPRTYRQARIYAKLLFKRKCFLKALQWRLKHLLMKFEYILHK